jgi:hypothetical protein
VHYLFEGIGNRRLRDPLDIIDMILKEPGYRQISTRINDKKSLPPKESITIMTKYTFQAFDQIHCDSDITGTSLSIP